jgi:hypothetical protein
MLQDWRRLFRQTEQGAGSTDLGDPEHLRHAVANASLDTPLTQIGFSTRALNVLERAHVINVHDLLRLPARQVYAMPGVGAKTRCEIADAIRLLAARFPPEERLPKPSTVSPSDTALASDASSIDRLVLRLLPKSQSPMKVRWVDILSVGREGEQTFGRRHFLDLLSSFTIEPLFSIKHGKLDIGRVHQSSFAVKEDHPPVLLLAGLSWVVTHNRLGRSGGICRADEIRGQVQVARIRPGSPLFPVPGDPARTGR